MKLFNKIAVALATVAIMSTAAIPASAAIPPRFQNRYILSGTVTDHCMFPGIETKTWCTIVDENEEEWVNAYDRNVLGLMPPVGMRVCMIMDNNGTPDDITDDIIEDVLWCDCDEDC